MMSKEQKLAESIVNAVGGLENMENVINCMTRVRIKVHDENKVNYDKLKSTEGVMGVVKDDRVQVVVGPGTVNKVAAHISEMSGVRLGETIPHQTKDYKAETEARAKENKAAFQSKQKRGKFNKLLKTIANIFIPLIPAFIGAGLIGGVIGGTTLLTGLTEENMITNIFTGEPLQAGQGGIIGVIFAVWLLSLVEKRLHKIVPNAIDIIVTPTITLFVIGLSTIFIIMPF